MVLGVGGWRLARLVAAVVLAVAGVARMEWLGAAAVLQVEVEVGQSSVVDG